MQTWEDFPYTILWCFFYYMVIVSVPASAYSINIDQVFAPSLLLQHILGYGLNSTKTRELLQFNNDTQGSLSPGSSVGGRPKTNRNYFLGPPTPPPSKRPQRLQSKLSSLNSFWSLILTNHATESLHTLEINKTAISKPPFPTACKVNFGNRF